MVKEVKIQKSFLCFLFLINIFQRFAKEFSCSYYGRVTAGVKLRISLFIIINKCHILIFRYTYHFTIMYEIQTINSRSEKQTGEE